MDNFSTNEENGVLIHKINLSRATAEYASEFKETLERYLHRDKYRIVVDFQQCEFTDSSFLSVLISTLKSLIKKGGNLKLVCARNDIESMLEATGLSKIFEIYNSQGEAINSKWG